MRGLSAAPTLAVITVILVFLLLGAGAVEVFAQVGSGTLTGVVRDQAGAVGEGSFLTLRQLFRHARVVGVSARGAEAVGEFRL
jgi:hypothetical protein